MSEYSKACCTLPPAVADNYTTKGSFETIGGSKTYVTGAKDAKKAVFWMYDIFGFSPSTLQGADILAAGGYLVAIPDLLNSRFAQAKWYGNPTEDDKKEQSEFMQYIRDMPQHLERLHASLDGLKKEFPAVESWAPIGFCWGGKVSAITSGKDTPWAVSVQSSPAMVDPEDAAKITIPHLVIASKDEPKDKVKEFEAALKGPHHVTTFDTMPHGFMSARADFKNPEAKAEFERGYQLVGGFLQKHL